MKLKRIISTFVELKYVLKEILDKLGILKMVFSFMTLMRV